MKEVQVTREMIKYFDSKEEITEFNHIDPPQNNSIFFEEVKNFTNNSRFKDSYRSKRGGADIRVVEDNKIKVIESKGYKHLAHNFQTGLIQLLRYADNVNSNSFEYSIAVPYEGSSKIQQRIKHNEKGRLSEAFKGILEKIDSFESEWNIYLVSNDKVHKESLKNFLISV